MRNVIHARLVKRNRQIATNLFLITFVVLIGGFLFVNVGLFTGQQMDVSDPLLLLIQAVILPVAFILTLISIRMTNLWARQPYPEKIIDENLKGLSQKSVIYHYCHLPARHVLICPQGIYVITTRWHSGKYVVNGDHWRSLASFISRMFSTMRMDGIGSPTLDAKRAAAYVQSKLEPIAPKVTVKPLILMIDPQIEVDAKDSEIPILFANPKNDRNLTNYLREQLRLLNESNKKGGSTLPLTDEQLAQFEAQTLPKTLA